MTSPRSPSPRRSRIGWLAGLPVLALLWAGATVVTAPIVGNALLSQSAAIVRETSAGDAEPWLRVEAQGRDLVALGETSDAASREAALGRLAAIPGLRRLEDRTGAIETASPFVWTLTRTSETELVAGGDRPVGLGSGALARMLAPALPPGAGLRDRAKAALGAPADFTDAATRLTGLMQGLAPGAVGTLKDTTISLQGDAVDSATFDSARAIAPPPGFRLGAIEIRPPKTDDFRFVAERSADGALTLSGNVVSAEARTQALALAASLAAGAQTPVSVRDTLAAARGLDPAIDPAGLTRFSLRLAGLLREGSVRFRHGRLSISGIALDDEALAEIETAMRGERPAGVAQGEVELTVRPVSPYWVRIRREPTRVIVSGYLPDRASRELVEGALRKRFLRETISDRSRLSSGAPERLVAALTGSLGPLADLSEGTLEVDGRALRLAGVSLYAESAGRLAADLERALPAGWTSKAEVVASEPRKAHDAATCARLFSERVGGRTLRFAPGSSELTPDFYPVLDAVADVAKACRSERVEVLGHIDPAGAPAPAPEVLPEAKAEKDISDKAKSGKSQKRRKLSEKAKPAQPSQDPEPTPDLATARASAVVDYLLKAGVPPEHALAAQGATPLSDRQGIGLALRS